MGDENTPIQFDGTGSSDPDGTIVLYEWDFGDGSSGTGATPTHAYSLAGPYVATLCVTDDEGARSCCTADVTVLPPSAVEIASFTATVGPSRDHPRTTSFEQDNLGFYIERAADGVTATSGSIRRHGGGACRWQPSGATPTSIARSRRGTATYQLLGRG